jgi:mRNA-degrading endonuclease toxin of MazEF toxin-antitoxin module
MADESAFERGHVIWHDGLFKTTARPWFILSDNSHPFHGEEYLVAGVTTTQRPDAIELSETGWVVGGLPEPSYVSPWFVTTLKHADIDQGIGMVTDDLSATVCETVRTYLS